MGDEWHKILPIHINGWFFYGKLVGKYTIRPMDPMGKNAKKPLNPVAIFADQKKD